MTIGGSNLLLLDTSVFVHLTRRDEMGNELLARFRIDERPDRPLFSTISEGEIRAISLRRGWGAEKRARLTKILGELVRIEAGLPEVIEAYAELHATSLQFGLNIGENDLWIAASAKAADAVVLTCDRDFCRIPVSFVQVEYVPRSP